LGVIPNHICFTEAILGNIEILLTVRGGREKGEERETEE
jgi:hypothetical protein